MPCLVDDQLWQLIEPLLPRPPRRYRHPGRKRLDDSKVLTGIVFVLTTGIAWQRLPQELGYGSGMTCWRRLHEWQQAGVLPAPPPTTPCQATPGRAAQPLPCGLRLLLAARAFGGEKTGPSPVDRARAGRRTRYERRADIHQAFLDLGCSLICHRQLRSSLC
jgi:hypothetical protein